LKNSTQKTSPKFSLGRYILIVGSALILAIMLYTVLNITDKSETSDIEALAEVEPEIENVRGTEPASFQEVREFQERGVSRLNLSGNGEAGAVVIITNRGERRRQVRVNDLGQWDVAALCGRGRPGHSVRGNGF